MPHLSLVLSFIFVSLSYVLGATRVFPKVRVEYLVLNPQTNAHGWKSTEGELTVDESKGSAVLRYLPIGASEDVVVPTVLPKETWRIMRDVQEGAKKKWSVSQRGAPRMPAIFSTVVVNTDPGKPERVSSLSLEFSARRLFEVADEPSFEEREERISVQSGITGEGREPKPVPLDPAQTPVGARLLWTIERGLLDLPTTYVVQKIGETTKGTSLVVMADQVDDRKITAGIKIAVFEVPSDYLATPIEKEQIERAMRISRGDNKQKAIGIVVRDQESGEEIVQHGVARERRHGPALRSMQRAELEVPDDVDLDTFLEGQGKRLVQRLSDPPNDDGFATHLTQSEMCRRYASKLVSPQPSRN